MPVGRPPGATMRYFLVAAGLALTAGQPFPAPAAEPAPVSAPNTFPLVTSPFPLETDGARAAIADLRVYLDFDADSATFATWPVDRSLRPLPADQIARGVRLGLALWASVLPDMRFRFVNRPAEANLCIRFGEYAHSGIRPDGARAFLPRQWASLDAECGRLAENRYPDGKPCEEWRRNIIIVHTRTWAVRDIDFTGNELVYRCFAWIFDPALPHYAPQDGGPCRDGKAAGTGWSDTCVPFLKSPLYDSLKGADLASIIQHEFGHTLMGDHAQSPYDCVDHARRPMIRRDSCVRISEEGFSSMFPGDGIDGWWNRRGVFEADAARLRRKGYRVSYPGTGASIVLARKGGEVKRVSDWRAAQRAIIWPLQPAILTPGQAGRQWFVVDVELP